MVKILRSCLVTPENDTLNQNIWLSDIDLFQPRIHTPTVMFYKHNGNSDFFNIEVVKTGLRKALVPFYPLAGRLGTDENGRPEIVCNAMGALFVEAEAEMTLEEFGDYVPSLENQLLFVPYVDLEDDDEAIPLLLIQVTLFKCGSICIGTGIHHFIADGYSNFHFINSWCYFTSSPLLPLTLPPFHDRRLLRPRHSPLPSPSTDYLSGYDLFTANTIDTKRPPVTSRILKLTRHQVSIIKNQSGPRKTTYQAIAAHIWKCICKAQNIDINTESHIFILAESRNRLRPSLLQGYFGNVYVGTGAVEKVCNVIDEPLSAIAEKVQNAIAQVDDEYFWSIMNFLAEQEDVKSIDMLRWNFGKSDLVINCWKNFPLYETDFGWGKPMFSGPACSLSGMCCVLPSSGGDGGIWIAITLETQCMERFKELFFVG